MKFYNFINESLYDKSALEIIKILKNKKNKTDIIKRLKEEFTKTKELNKKNEIKKALLYLEKNGNISNLSKQYIKAYTSRGGQDHSQFSKYNEFYKHFEDEIKHSPKFHGMIYRNINVSENEWEKMFNSGYVETGNIITFDKLSSASKDIIRTATFFGQNYQTQRIVFKIKANGKNCVDIEELSHYKEEKEVLMLPNTKIKVIDWEYKNGKVYIEAEEI